MISCIQIWKGVRLALELCSLMLTVSEIAGNTSCEPIPWKAEWVSTIFDGLFSVPAIAVGSIAITQRISHHALRNMPLFPISGTEVGV
jgi:hypothetical protein